MCSCHPVATPKLITVLALSKLGPEPPSRSVTCYNITHTGHLVSCLYSLGLSIQHFLKGLSPLSALP